MRRDFVMNIIGNGIEKLLRMIRNYMFNMTFTGENVIVVTAEDDLKILDTLANNLPNHTQYKRSLDLIVAVSCWPKGGGGWYVLDGFKTEDAYELQTVTSYNKEFGYRAYVRSKVHGVWGEWIDLYQIPIH